MEYSKYKDIWLKKKKYIKVKNRGEKKKEKYSYIKKTFKVMLIKNF